MKAKWIRLLSASLLAFLLTTGFIFGVMAPVALGSGGDSKFGAKVEATIERPAKQAERARATVTSVWDIECFDKRGNLKWEIKGLKNIVTNEGLDALLDIMFHADTQITVWYVLIFETNTTPAAAHTYAVPVFTESTSYDEATRPAWVEAAASSQSITNSANKATFTISATKTIYGAALVGGGSAPTTKGNTAGGGVLYASVKFGTSKSVVDDDVLKVTVTLTSSDV